MVRVLLLGDIPVDQQWIEAEWIQVLQGRGHSVSALLPGGRLHPRLQHLPITLGDKKHGWLSAAVRLAQQVRPELVVAFNARNLAIAMCLRAASRVRVHYHAHEVFGGRLSTSPYELAAIRVARYADWMSVPNSDRARLLAPRHQLRRPPYVVANYRAKGPDALLGRPAPASNLLLIADQQRALTDSDTTYAAEEAARVGMRLAVTGRAGPYGTGLLPMEDYLSLSSTAAVAVTITRPFDETRRLAAPYRAGWFLSLGVPQVISAGCYAEPFVKSGAALSVSPDAAIGDVMRAAISANRQLAEMSTNAIRAFNQWGNLEAQLSGVAWV